MWIFITTISADILLLPLCVIFGVATSDTFITFIFIVGIISMLGVFFIAVPVAFRTEKMLEQAKQEQKVYDAKKLKDEIIKQNLSQIETENEFKMIEDFILVYHTKGFNKALQKYKEQNPCSYREYDKNWGLDMMTLRLKYKWYKEIYVSSNNDILNYYRR